MHYTWDQNAPKGERIIELIDAEGNKIDPYQTYSVTVNNFLATGGDGFTVFTEGMNQVAGPIDLDAMIEYIKNFEGFVPVQTLDRINIK